MPTDLPTPSPTPRCHPMELFRKNSDSRRKRQRLQKGCPSAPATYRHFVAKAKIPALLQEIIEASPNTYARDDPLRSVLLGN